MSNDDLSHVFQASRENADPPSPERTNQIVKRARREVVARDFLTFSLVRMWSTLLGLIEVLLPIGKPRPGIDGSKRPSNDEASPTTERR